VLNGDIITSENPTELLATFRHSQTGNSNHLASIMVVPMVSPYGLVDLNSEDDVIGFREKAEMAEWINAGIYVFNRRIFDLLPTLGDHETKTFPALAKSGQISALRSRAFWRSVDSFKDLKEAEEYLEGRGRSSIASPSETSGST
jgi:NDP-sugar pyrophosphorylase family protein